ncbi:hypothetical protein BT93_I0314 [Corymbia citriodora subsp. variegata]|nr:hypothetical protein BT93_I0314 [Corymbia citriodora subsp. variegata]
MSAPVTFTEDFSSPIPAPRMFKALILDGDNLIPKLMPQAVKSVELTHGDGGPGSIKQMNFAEGSQMKYIKHRVDALDKEKMTYSYTMVDGGELASKIESITYDVKMEATPDGGCKGTNVSKYHPKPGFGINEEEIKAGKEKAAAVFKAVEAHLLANPEAYA